MTHSIEIQYDITRNDGEVFTLLAEVLADSYFEDGSVYIEDVEIKNIRILVTTGVEYYDSPQAIPACYPQDEIQAIWTLAEKEIVKDRDGTIEHYREMHNQFN